MKPRIGFLGVGWIGRNRLQAIADTGAVEIVAFAEPSDAAATQAQALAPHAARAPDLAALLDFGLDGVVIATPSAQHAAEAIVALERGVAVFCQKPLGRTAVETEAVVEAARAADRRLAVDLSYRETSGMRAVRSCVQGGEIGAVHAVDLTFHNAYGPDKPWFYDRVLSGGGCVIDLGVHLVDIALWTLDFPEVVSVSSDLFSQGRPLGPDAAQVEDFALATLRLASGAVVRLACSWNLPAGREAVIEATFWGGQGGASFRNVAGSFFNFEAQVTHGSADRRTLFAGEEAWGGRAAAAWAQRLTDSSGFDTATKDLVTVAHTLDRIYGRPSAATASSPHLR